MLDQRQLYFAALHQAGVLAESFERLCRQIASLQQDQGEVFREPGVGCGSRQALRRRAANSLGEGSVGGGGSRSGRGGIVERHSFCAECRHLFGGSEQPSGCLAGILPAYRAGRTPALIPPLRARSSAPRTGSITFGLMTASGCAERRLL